MKALKCDICGGLVEFVIPTKGKPAIPNKLQFYYKDEFDEKSSGRLFDICPDCYAAIKKTIDDRRKITIEPNEDDLK